MTSENLKNNVEEKLIDISDSSKLEKTENIDGAQCLKEENIIGFISDSNRIIYHSGTEFFSDITKYSTLKSSGLDDSGLQLESYKQSLDKVSQENGQLKQEITQLKEELDSTNEKNKELEETIQNNLIEQQRILGFESGDEKQINSSTELLSTITKNLAIECMGYKYQKTAESADQELREENSNLEFIVNLSQSYKWIWFHIGLNGGKSKVSLNFLNPIFWLKIPAILYGIRTGKSLYSNYQNLKGDEKKIEEFNSIIKNIKEGKNDTKKQTYKLGKMLRK